MEYEQLGRNKATSIQNGKPSQPGIHTSSNCSVQGLIRGHKGGRGVEHEQLGINEVTSKMKCPSTKWQSPFNQGSTQAAPAQCQVSYSWHYARRRACTRWPRHALQCLQAYTKLPAIGFLFGALYPVQLVSRRTRRTLACAAATTRCKFAHPGGTVAGNKCYTWVLQP